MNGSWSEPHWGLLTEIESSLFLTRYPGRLRAFEDGIEVVRTYGRFWGTRRMVQRVGYGQIVQVSAESNGRFLASHSVLVQTANGATLSLNGLTETAAQRVVILLIERMSGA